MPEFWTNYLINCDFIFKGTKFFQKSKQSMDRDSIATPYVTKTAMSSPPLTLTQLERGLTDKSGLVRGSFICRADCTLTQEQIERGSTDESDDVRWMLVNRADFKPTSAQIQRGLTDKLSLVRSLYEYILNKNDLTGKQ